MKRLFVAILLASSFLLQACGTVKIESNKQAGYTKQPKKMFILVDRVSKESSLFAAGLVNNLKQQLKLKGVDADTYVKSALSFDTAEEINKKLTSYNPEVALIISEVVTGQNSGSFELSLRDQETQKNVWKSELAISAENTYSDQTSLIDRSVRTIIRKLTEDKIL